MCVIILTSFVRVMIDIWQLGVCVLQAAMWCMAARVRLPVIGATLFLGIVS